MKKKLLVVDDEVDIGELIVELAEDKGLEVRAVNDSADVEAMLDTFAPDAIMLDLMMPGTDGVELLKTLADKVKGARIALMSGTDARVLNSARRLGSAHGLNIVKTLEKPLDISAIRETIDVLMAGDAPASAAPAPSLSLALSAGQIQVFVQPLVSTQSSAVMGLEILPRWPQPNGSMLTPADFLAGTVEAAQLATLTHEMFEAALPQLAALMGGTAVFAAFNVVPTQLDAAFADWLAGAMQKNKLQPAHIALECTEEALLAAGPGVADALGQLRLLGVSIWLDDFAARSSIVDLQRLPIAGFKLSRSLSGACEEPSAQVTIKAALALAQALGKKLIAVAVENERQRGVLAGLGVDGMQGNAISAPLPLADAAAWLQQNAK